MKKYIVIALLTVMVSCSKEKTQNQISTSAAYLGTYNPVAAENTLVTVSTNGNYVKIRWEYRAGANENIFVFDSVRVSSDLSFTVNQALRNQPKESHNTQHAIGSGNFGTNTIHFRFDITQEKNQSSAGYIPFDGIKQ